MNVRRGWSVHAILEKVEQCVSACIRVRTEVLCLVFPSRFAAES